MSEHAELRVRFQESGGGWGNPLMGRVFDSARDVPAGEMDQLAELVDRCRLAESGELPGERPVDVETFELAVERGGRTVSVVGDMQRADDALKELVQFVRRRSRREMLE